MATLRTQLVGGSRLMCDKSWADHGRPHPGDYFGRLYYLRSGRGHVTHHGRTIPLQPGHLTAIPAFTPCSYICPSRMDLSYLHFKATVLGSLEPFDCFGWPYDVEIHDLETMNRIWDQFLASNPSGDHPGNPLEADGLLRQILARFSTSISPDHSLRLQQVQRLQPVFIYIEQHLASVITLADMARQVNLQPTYFSNRFTEVMGMSPMTYVIRQRVERAQGLLRRKDQKLQAIAEAVGYQDAFYFSRVFKRVTGMAPSDYRNRKPTEGTSGGA